MPIDTRVNVQGVAGTIEILIDTWGVPHIYADSVGDLFFGQGYQAARLRLWQMDTWRRRGLGQVAEVLGEQYLNQDRMARLLLYRGDVAEEAKRYGPHAYGAVVSFVAGVNAYIDAVNLHPAELPPEFTALDYRPARWSVEDIFRIRAGGRHDNAREEIIRSVTLHRYGREAERLRKPLSSDWELRVPTGLDLAEIDEDVLTDFNQFMVFMSSADPHLPGGSNHWAVSAAKTATGRPILANDPHRDMSAPSLRYLCHLHGPGIDVIGGAEPYRPGITIGHNQDVAFGLTIFPCDQEDVYVYEANEDGTRYRYGDGWLECEVIEDEFAVKGRSPVKQRLMFTRHGPVVASHPDRRRAYGLRAAWLEPGGVPYFQANMRCMFAKSIDDVRDIAVASVSPGINMIFADRAGNIGLRPAGAVPRRPNWDGLLPVPGDGRYEWEGLLPIAELLDTVNPAEGWVGSGNQFNVPQAVEAGLPVCLEAEPNHRYNRIGQLLAAASKHSVADSQQLQMDVTSLPAIALTRLLNKYAFGNEEAEAARQVLAGWDGVLSADSRAAALFEFWWRRSLLPAAMRQHLVKHGSAEPDAAVAHIFKNTDSSKTPDAWLRLVEQASLEAPGASLLEETLLSASRALRDSGATCWGDVHTLSLVHPLAKSLPAGSAFEAVTVVGTAVRVGGDGDTVNNTGFRPDWSQRLGASLRIVYDVGAWDNCTAMAVPGQSGVPTDSHFGDLCGAWQTGQAFPLLFSRSAIEAATSNRILISAPSS